MTHHFHRLGRAWHLEIDDAASLAAVLTLDDALWIATSAPTSTLHADAGLLRRVDADGDGRIDLANLKAAVTWLFDNLADTSGVRPAYGPLRIESIKDPGVRASAETVLRRGGRVSDAAVTLERVRAVRQEEESKGLSIADRALPGAAEDEALAAYVQHAIAVTAGVAHPSGEKALSPQTLASFQTDLAAWTEWVALGTLDGPEATTTVMPLGEKTAAAAAAVAAVVTQVDSFFVLCDAARVDAGVVERAWPRIEPTADGIAFDPAAVTATLLAAPVARPNPGGLLRLDGELNPAWAAPIAALFELAAVPLGTGRAGLDRSGWLALQGRLAAYNAWVAARPRDGACGRDEETISRHLASASLPAAVEALFARSRESAALVAGFDAVERLVLYQGGLIPLASSFVSCTDLFRDGREPLFNAGQLIADGRRFRLAIRVPDKARSLMFAPLASAFLVYAHVGRAAGAWDYEVVVPVTAGERGTLIAGAYCAFIDRDGNEMLAQINAVIANPISVKEALVQPLLAIPNAIEAWLEKRKASAESSLTQAGGNAVTAAESVPGQVAAAPVPAPPPGAPAAAAPPMGPAAMVAMLTGVSIAIAALGSAFAFIAGFFSSLSPLGALGVLAALVAAFAIPTALLAWMKLRRRDVAALLEGSGWGVNHRLRIERPFALKLTERPSLPSGSATSGKDAGDGPLLKILWTLVVVGVVVAVLVQFRGLVADTIGIELPEAPATSSSPEPSAPAD